MPKGDNQPMARCPDNEFLQLMEAHGPAETARRLRIDPRRVYERRVNLERKIGRQITGPDHPSATRHHVEYEGRLYHDIENGTVVVGSDAHFWPDIETVAYRAFVKFIKEFKPALIVMNGDMVDGASISRHPPIGWESLPSLIQEIEAVKDRLGTIEAASGRIRKIWTLGNHDARFSTRLATVAPQYANVHGVQLKDHFPHWEAAWSCWVNESTVIKHRYKGGLHATHNNTLNSGKTVVTGHLHSLKVTPFSDYAGTRWGVDTGTMAEPYGQQFAYQEDNARNHRSGFAVLTYYKGRLLWPELVSVFDHESVEFRGKVHRIGA